MLVPYLPLFKTETSKHAQRATTPPDEMVEEIDSDGDLLIDNDELYVTDTDTLDPDSDDDGMLDGDEYKYWTDRYDKALKDGVPDWLTKKYPYLTDSERRGLYQSTGDLDGDGMPNIKDKDSDGDGLPDGFEKNNGLDPGDPNSNYDDLPDNLKRYIMINNYPGNELLDFKNEVDLDDFETELLDSEDFNSELFSISPAAHPRYWRTSVFDYYQNGHWYSTNNRPDNQYTLGDELSYENEVKEYNSKREVSYTVTFNGWSKGMLPTALHTTSIYSIDPSVDIKYNSIGTFQVSQRVKSYSFNATIYEYDENKLLTANAPAKDDIENDYLLKPGTGIHTKITTLTQTIIAGKNSDFAKVTAIANYLASNYIYDLNSYDYNLKYYNEDIRNDYLNSYEKHLINMLTETYRGRCIDFASAFVLMCRVGGIPAQLATGFAPGDIEDPESNERILRLGHRHAWGEVLFDEPGWLAFEVTPSTSIYGNTTGVTVAGDDNNVITVSKEPEPDVVNFTFDGSGGGTTTHDYLDLLERINHPKLDDDLDGIKNDKDTDDDNDGLSDTEELELGTNPFNKDTDRDKISDYDEVRKYKTSPVNSDTDSDGLTDYYELETSKTDPTKYDTDSGGAHDGLEVQQNGNPKDPSDDREYMDSDLDGLSDAEEDRLGTDPNDPDTDSGGAKDKLEVIAGLNPINNTQDDLKVIDTDGDGLMDAKEIEIGSDRFLYDTDSGGIADGPEYLHGNDPVDSSDDYWLKDSDKDGLLNKFEDKNMNNIVDEDDDGYPIETDPDNPDSDGGGIDDGVEVNSGTDPLDSSDDRTIDSDGDGLSNLLEKDYGTDPNNRDTDFDGLPDGWIDGWSGANKNGEKDLGEFEDRDLDGRKDYGEWNDGAGPGETHPNNQDTDDDRLIDGLEIKFGTDPLDWDSDDDGLSDWEEVQHLTDPNNDDTDDDGITDYDEIYLYKSNPTLLDSDGDGIADYLEIDYGTDPLNWDTDADGVPDWDEINLFDTSPINNKDFPTDFNPGGNLIPANPPTIPSNPDTPTPDPTPPDTPTPNPNTPGVGGGGSPGVGGNLATVWPVLIGLILIIIIALYYISWRSQHIEEIAEVAEQAEERLTRIEDEREFDSIRLAIFEAYKSMLKVMQRYDFVREPSMTPAEFEYVIASALPISDKNLSALTKIFEEARYSDHELNIKIRDEAINSFRALKEELRGVRRFGAASQIL